MKYLPLSWGLLFDQRSRPKTQSCSAEGEWPSAPPHLRCHLLGCRRAQFQLERWECTPAELWTSVLRASRCLCREEENEWLNEQKEEETQEMPTPQAANHLLSIEGMLCCCWEALVEVPLMLRALCAGRSCLCSAMCRHFIFYRLEGFPNLFTWTGIISYASSVRLRAICWFWWRCGLTCIFKKWDQNVTIVFILLK